MARIFIVSWPFTFLCRENGSGNSDIFPLSGVINEADSQLILVLGSPPLFYFFPLLVKNMAYLVDIVAGKQRDDLRHLLAVIPGTQPPQANMAMMCESVNVSSLNVHYYDLTP